MRITKENEKITITIVGAGNRGRVYIDSLNTFFTNKFEVKYLFEPKKENQDYFIQNYNVKKENCYNGIKEFVLMPRLTDIVIISTLDTLHYEPCVYAIKQGYDILLEKPIAFTLEETLSLYKEAKQRNTFIGVCHTNRHSPFFIKIKEIIDSKKLGKVIDIQHNENIGYYHFAHSYVRGNWRNTDIAAPSIVAKSCHDMDILLFLLGKKCLRLSSFGSLNYFVHKNFKKNMAHKCFDCPKEINCPYSCIKIYGGELIKSVTFDKTSQETFKNSLFNSNYSTCVFDSDNNVCDHQVTILEFEGGVHATFNMSAFTNKISRTIKVMCELGEIRGDGHLKVIEVLPFGGEKETIVLTKGTEGGHGGGDIGIMRGFINSYLGQESFDSPLDASIEGHVMAFLADVSRLKKGKVMNIQKAMKDALRD